jgi:hypothetical protein
MISSTPELFVTDMDGTLTDNNLVARALGRACTAEGINAESLLELVDSYAQLEISYNAWSYVEKYGPNAAEAVEARFLEDCRENPIVYNDTREYLNFLEESFIANLIMTNGNQTWQEMKLKAAGLDKLPHQIIHPDDLKGNVIRGWRNAPGKLFIVPQEIFNVSVSIVNVVDDKKKSFHGLPKDCRGYWDVRDEKKYSAIQTEDLPPNIKPVRNLREIIEDINRRYF